mmetsp:Transcript_17195/g.26616  ORF Transcript_17195/g.26616 Transcript_17195/m.26616 type:complete len:502 (-) Transcript_17195:1193-2698(-)
MLGTSAASRSRKAGTSLLVRRLGQLQQQPQVPSMQTTTATRFQSSWLSPTSSSFYNDLPRKQQMTSNYGHCTFASDTKGGIEITKTTATSLKSHEEEDEEESEQETPATESVQENDNHSDDDDDYEQQMPNPQKEGEIRKLQHEVSLHHQHGQYAAALDSSKLLLDKTERWFGKDHPATATAYNNIGLMSKLVGDFKVARTNFYEALRIYERVVGKDHSSYAAALHNLGNLNRSQVYLDETVTAMERLKLNEDAIEYLEEAYQIRKLELGDEHPHTVASRSNLGSTIATQVLQQMANSSKETRQTPSKLTKRRWEAAEDHLRASLQTSIHNPRGKKKVDMKQQQQRNPLKQKQQLYSRITTLSAASAAQNLAVFLKGRATAGTPPPTPPTSDGKNTTAKQDEATQKRIKQYRNDDSLVEAKQLYEAALFVRTKLLHDAHPDLVATKFSLAELLSTFGDEEGANKLRNEIVDSYDVEESEDDPVSSSSSSPSESDSTPETKK